jgi:tRNA pseudouridine synthase 10
MEKPTHGNEEIVRDAEGMAEKLVKRQLCDSCLGRLFSKLGHGLDNGTRGRLVRAHFGWAERENCEVCGGLIKEIPKFKELAMKRLGPNEFGNFLVGSRIEPSVLEAEESLWVELGAQHAEPIKSEINREVGKLLEAELKKPVEFERPDIVAVVDTAYDNIELQIAPLYIYGRYRKLVRGIPQTRWPCRWCLGKGCEKCDFTGRMYRTSVEEIVATEVMKHSGGIEHAFHGMGREDIDVLMLGNGRPFVLEIKNPVKRTFDLGLVEDAVNQGSEVSVSGLRPSSSDEVVKLKSAKPVKTYRVLAKLESPAGEEKLKMVVGAFKGREIDQRTPTRVAHRRADKVRKRRVLNIEIKRLSDDMTELEVTAEAGTYIKELVHGDDGRTSPSLAQMLQTKTEVLEVDVIGIGEE